ncbi:low temperature requirement protein A [Cryobacterium sp. TMT1-62]|uniref:low temperature requirement protein A n=1 Tax=unclassified Cryobacterium TaxID=2649013 RepID=UPI00106B31B1|nr:MULTISPECIES: low temperature requirement protein A [unclassified Cryobacterium]TFC47413.1 low temperature requirement protein A [Cryobacterium sp. TMT2-17-1]TFC54175.1 low temperature requirement protein A [Cryobacterium sp. TMT2-15-1]TFC70274.1 low temperature requirement protein A [Cryobacterium sp. TMT2-4]TFD30991.1 low temperature requirement protein A [Cryobacterium sp. TMT1-62]
MNATPSTVPSAPGTGRRPAGRFGLRLNLMRPDRPDLADRVTYIELFFDLIFVFALTQLSRHLYENQSWQGAAESVILVLALWWIWVHTTWVTNLLDPARLPVRGVVIGLSLVGLVVSVSIYESFGDRGFLFAVAYVTLQLGRTAFMALALALHDRALFRAFVRIFLWLAVAGLFWILGGLLPADYRLLLWATALGIEFVSAKLGFPVPGLGRATPGDGELSGPHIAERSALFVIIALGESFLVTGFAFVDQDVSVPGVLGLLLAFVSGAAMWWLYFDHSEYAGSKALADAADPGRLARLAYTYVHAMLIAGIVLSSVGVKEILAHPDDPVIFSTAVAITGGPLLYLLGLALFRFVVAREVLISHVTGIALLLLALPLAFALSPLALGALGALMLTTVACWGTIVRVRNGTAEKEAG